MIAPALHLARRLGTAAGVVGLIAGCGDAKSSDSAGESAPPADTTPPREFATPESAAAALIAAAEKFDVPALKAILGGQGADLVETEDTVQDRRTARRTAEPAYRGAAGGQRSRRALKLLTKSRRLRVGRSQAPSGGSASRRTRSSGSTNAPGTSSMSMNSSSSELIA